MIDYVLATAAGLATLLSPCILPVLPIVLATSSGRGRIEPLLVIGGFVSTFAAGGILIGALAASSGELQGSLRAASILVLLIAGIVCFWPAPFDWLVNRFQRALPAGSARLQRVGRNGGKLGALLVGVSLGLAWTPCAGPILASVLSLAATAQAPAKASLLLGLYAIGAGLPMLAIAYGGNWVTSRLGVLQRRAPLIRRFFGAIAIGVALLQLLQYDVFVTAWATQWLPAVSSGL